MRRQQKFSPLVVFDLDKRKGLINVVVSIVFRLLLFVGGIFARRYLIQCVGNDANGLSSLYTSIIGFLAVAELGVGTAISYCMYKPIVEGNTEEVSALYRLFTRLYLVIGGIILVGGCVLMPFLPYLVGDYQSVDFNLYITFGIMLVATVLTYAYSSKTSLINAYKNNYVTTTITSVAQIVQYVLQIVVVILTRSFEAFLVCYVICALLQWIMTEIYARKKYMPVLKGSGSVSADTKKSIVRNVKGMFMHKAGSALVNASDSIIISAFIGSEILGKYSNYTIIMTNMTSVITLFFTPLTAIIGHLCVRDDREEIQRYFNFFYAFNFMLAVVFFLGYYGIIDNLVTIFFEDPADPQGLVMDKSVSIIVTINYLLQFMRQATLLFRDATGTFYYDRWKPVIEGVLNVALSIGFAYLFGRAFGEEYELIGIIAATIVTNLAICHTVEPFVLFKYALHASAKKFFIKNYACIAVFGLALLALHFSMQSFENEWVELVVNGFISVGISSVIVIGMFFADKDFRHYVLRIFTRVKAKLKGSSDYSFRNDG